MNNKKNINCFFLLISAVCWGGSFVLTKHLLYSFTPIGIILFRLLLASILFITIDLFFFRKHFWIKKQDVKFFFAIALFEPIIYFICETYSLRFCDASVVSVIIATIPLFTSLFAVIFFNEDFTIANFIGVFISIIGIILMVYPELSTSSLSGKGILLAFGAVLASVGYNFFLKRIPSHYPSIVIVSWQNLIGLVGFAILFLIFNDKESIIQQCRGLQSPVNFSALLILSIFCSSVAFILYISALRVLGMAKSNTFTNLIPVITALISFFLFGESITYFKVSGIVIVVVGIYLVQGFQSKARLNS